MKFTRLALAISILGSVLSVAFWARPAAAVDCLVLPTGAQLVVKLNLETESTYRLWVRQVTPATGNQLFTSVDGGCAAPIAKNTQSDKLSWSGADNNAQPLLFTLAAGEHTLVLAGDYTGIAVDLGLLTTDHACIPQETGQNCFNAEQAAGEVIPIPDEPIVVPETVSKKDNKWGLALAIAALLAMLGVMGFLVRYYLGFIKKVLPPPLGAASPLTQQIKHALSLPAFRQFFYHHRSMVVMYGTAFIVFCILFVIGGAAAEQHRAVIFEAENGSLSGDAKVVADAQASSGSYVLFGGTPPVITGSAKTPDKPVASDGPGPQTGGGSANPTPDPGGGGTPLGECPPFPAFPDENCTGWRHTGRQSLQNCDDRTDHGYIWDDNPDKTFIGCYFSTRLVVQAANVIIKESQIHGAIVAHGSSGFSLRGAQFIDVEIENCFSTTDCTTVNPNMDYNNDTAAITGHEFKCLRCHVHNMVTGIHPGNYAEVIDSYMHDFQIEPDTNDENHNDRNHGVAIGSGQNSGHHSKIIHNNIQCNRLVGQYQQCSSALSLYSEPSIDDVLVKNNLFNARNGWCVIGGASNGTNIRFIDNYFGKKYNPYCGGNELPAPVAFFYLPNDNVSQNGGLDGGCTMPQATSPRCNWGNVWQGNVWADGSGPVPFKD